MARTGERTPPAAGSRSPPDAAATPDVAPPVVPPPGGPGDHTGPPAAPTPDDDGRHDGRDDDDGEDLGPDNRWALVAGAIAVVALAVLGFLVVTGNSGVDDDTTSNLAGVVVTSAVPSTGGGGGSAATDAGSARQWAATNLPGVPVVTTSATVAAGGTTTVASLDAVPTGQAVVSVGDAARVTAVGDDRTLVPLAAWTSGAVTTSVGVLVGRPVADVTADAASLAATQAAALAGLRQNLGVTFAADASGVVAAAGLDVRAAALLAAIATTEPVQVVSATADAAETAAGVAVRRIVVVADDPSQVQAVAAAARGSYAPTVTAAGADAPAGALQLTWPVVSDPGELLG